MCLGQRFGAGWHCNSCAFLFKHGRIAVHGSYRLTVPALRLQVQSGLAEFLETKRVMMSRFYFITDAELLHVRTGRGCLQLPQVHVIVDWQCPAHHRSSRKRATSQRLTVRCQNASTPCIVSGSSCRRTARSVVTEFAAVAANNMTLSVVGRHRKLWMPRPKGAEKRARSGCEIA
jgi:hypothetical protein